MKCTNCPDGVARARGLCSRCYKAERLAALAAGTWCSQSPPLVDGAAAAEHLDALAKAGVSRWQVVRLTGVHQATIYGISAGRRVAEETSASILGVPLPRAAHTLLAGNAFVPACGTTRRLQALCALGWPIAVLAERLGNDASHLAEVCRGDRRLVMAYTARAVDQLYERLSGTAGPSGRVRVMSRERGWAPPLAWADEEEKETNHIDNPNARPAHLRTGRRESFRERYDNLRALEPDFTSAQIADRLGITERSLARQLAPSRSKHGQTA